MQQPFWKLNTNNVKHNNKKNTEFQQANKTDYKYATRAKYKDDVRGAAEPNVWIMSIQWW